MLVSVVIPASQWDSFLDATLASVRRQEIDPDTEIEILVAIKDPPLHPPTGVTIIVNPTGSIPQGLNNALHRSTGSVIVRVDSRCDLPPHYLARCLEHLADPTIGMVGGAALARDAGIVSGAYAVAFNSPLLGPSAYRYSARSGPTESPYLGAWRRETLEAIGGWDERLLRNQDNELAERVRATGLTAWYDHELVVGYWANRSLPGLMRHHRDFGRWRRAQSALGQDGISTRHRAAIATVVGGSLASAALLAKAPPAARITALVAGYGATASAAVFTSRRLRARRPDLDGPRPGLRSIALVPVVAALIDAGWLSGIIGIGGSPPVAGDGAVDLREPLRPH
jgi:hypothetical protein